MTRKEAVYILEVLLGRDADCRCGNKWIEDEEKEAIQFFLDESDEALQTEEKN